MVSTIFYSFFLLGKKFGSLISSDISHILAKKYMYNIGIDDTQMMKIDNDQECLHLVNQDIFDVVLLGARFSNMSGNQIAREIKKKNNGKHPKIIAYIGDIKIDKEVFDKHILKPTTMNIFIESLYEVLMSIDLEKK